MARSLEYLRPAGYKPPTTFDDEAPFTDEEREKAGLGPLELPEQESRSQRDRRLKAQYREQERGRKREIRDAASKRAGRRKRVRSFPSRVRNSKAVGGATALATGRWAGVSPAGLIFGFFTWAVALNVTRYGPSGISIWFKAKWLNKTTTAAPSAKTSLGNSDRVNPTTGQPLGTSG